MPAELQRALFTVKKGEPTMVETPEAFLVAVPAEVIEPEAKSDPAGYEQVRTAVTRSFGGDLTSVFTEALRRRANVQINQKNFDQVVQP
jgi:peptidyl-prolyl cis-trans isomerase D